MHSRYINLSLLVFLVVVLFVSPYTTLVDAQKVYPSVILRPQTDQRTFHTLMPIEGQFELNFVLDEPAKPDASGQITWARIYFPINVGTTSGYSHQIWDCTVQVNDEEPIFIGQPSIIAASGKTISINFEPSPLSKAFGRLTTLCDYSIFFDSPSDELLIPSGYRGANDMYLPIVPNQSSFYYTIVNPRVVFKRPKPSDGSWDYQHVPQTIPADGEFHDMNFSFHIGIPNYSITLDFGTFPYHSAEVTELYKHFPQLPPFDIDLDGCEGHDDAFTYEWQVPTDVAVPGDLSPRSLQLTFLTPEVFSCTIKVRGNYQFDIQHNCDNNDEYILKWCDKEPVVLAKTSSPNGYVIESLRVIFFLIRHLQSPDDASVPLIPQGAATVRYAENSPRCQSLAEAGEYFTQVANCIEIELDADYESSIRPYANLVEILAFGGPDLQGTRTDVSLPTVPKSLSRGVVYNSPGTLFTSTPYPFMPSSNIYQDIGQSVVAATLPLSSSSLVLLYAFYDDEMFYDDTLVDAIHTRAQFIQNSPSHYSQNKMVNRDLLKPNGNGEYEFTFELFINGVPIALTGNDIAIPASSPDLNIPPHALFQFINLPQPSTPDQEMALEEFVAYDLRLSFHEMDTTFWSEKMDLSVTAAGVQIVLPNQLICDDMIQVTGLSFYLLLSDYSMYSNFDCTFKIQFMGASTQPFFVVLSHAHETYNETPPTNLQQSYSITTEIMAYSQYPLKPGTYSVGFLETRPLFLNQINFATIQVTGLLDGLSDINYGYNNISLRPGIFDVRCTNTNDDRITNDNYDDISYKAKFTISGDENSLMSLVFDESALSRISDDATQYGNTIACPFLPLTVLKYGRVGSTSNGVGSQTLRLTYNSVETSITQFPSTYALSVSTQLQPGKISSIAFNITSSITGRHQIRGPYTLDYLIGVPYTGDDPKSRENSIACVHTDYSTPFPHTQKVLGSVSYYTEGGEDILEFNNFSPLDSVSNPIWCSFAAARRFSLSVPTLVAPITFPDYTQPDDGNNGTRPLLSQYTVSSLYPSISYLPPVFDMTFTTAKQRKERGYVDELPFTSSPTPGDGEDAKYDILSIELYNVGITQPAGGERPVFRVTHFQPLDLSQRESFEVVCRDYSLPPETGIFTDLVRVVSLTEVSTRPVPGKPDQFELDYIIEFQFNRDIQKDMRHTCQTKLMYTDGAVKKPMTAIGSGVFDRGPFTSYLNLPAVTSSYDFEFTVFNPAQRQLQFVILNSGTDAPNNAIYVDLSPIGMPDSTFTCSQSETNNAGLSTPLNPSFSRVGGYTLLVPLGPIAVDTSYTITCEYRFKSSSSTLPRGVITQVEALLFENGSGVFGVARSKVQYTSQESDSTTSAVVLDLYAYKPLEGNLSAVASTIGSVVAYFLKSTDTSPSVHILRRSADFSDVSFIGATPENYRDFTKLVPERYIIALIGGGYDIPSFLQQFTPDNEEFVNSPTKFPVRPSLEPIPPHTYPARCFDNRAHNCGVGCPVRCYYNDNCSIDGDCESLFCVDSDSGNSKICKPPVFTLDDY